MQTALLPSYALVTWLIFKNKNLDYAEALIIDLRDLCLFIVVHPGKFNRNDQSIRQVNERSIEVAVLALSRDAFFEKANEIAKVIENQNILIPWPSLYETINTRSTKRKDYMQPFEIFINKPNVRLIKDEEYKNQALKLAFEYSKITKRTFSLVDIVLREILSDVSFKIDYLLTFNPGDFIDICNKKKIEIYD